MSSRYQFSSMRSRMTVRAKPWELHCLSKQFLGKNISFKYYLWKIFSENVNKISVKCIAVVKKSAKYFPNSDESATLQWLYRILHCTKTRAEWIYFPNSDESATLQWLFRILHCTKTRAEYIFLTVMSQQLFCAIAV